MVNETDFIIAARNYLEGLFPCYYEEAPTKGAFPYVVLNGIHTIPLSDGDLASFYLDIWVDEKKEGATEELERICDTLRTELDGAVIATPGIFASHIGFDSKSSLTDSEFDIAHRRLSLSARIFYN